MHDQRKRRGLDLQAPQMRLPAKGKTCRIPLCTAPMKARGMCAAHYARHWEGRPVTAPLRRERRGVERIYISLKPRDINRFEKAANARALTTRQVMEEILEAFAASLAGGSPKAVTDDSLAWMRRAVEEA